MSGTNQSLNEGSESAFGDNPPVIERLDRFKEVRSGWL